MLKMVTVVDPTNGSLESSKRSDDAVFNYKPQTESLSPVFRETAMSTEELSKAVFSAEERTLISTPEPSFVMVLESSTSSICTGESEAGVLSDLESNRNGMETPTKIVPGNSDQIKAILSLQKTSRQGRDLQRWITDEKTNETVRLVTGCVPILKGGKILLISANRKEEWILPKGGWEQDETMEESAARECFEEAGVLGELGSKLDEVQYETRKSKKRRLDAQFVEKEKKANTCEPEAVETTVTDSVEVKSSTLLTDDAIKKLEQDTTKRRPCDETHSTSSSHSGHYSQVRMTLFPLYVDTVSNSWPESERLRKAVDIDEAIRMLDSRTEFKAALLEVKRRGLHIHPSSR